MVWKLAKNGPDLDRPTGGGGGYRRGECDGGSVDLERT
jgi:hypothetical protein